MGAADRLIFGRRTYDGMAAYWRTETRELADFMNRLPKLVLSRTLAWAEWANTTLVTTDVVAAVRELKRQGEGMSLVFGSADLSGTLVAADLFDEYRLCVTPVVLGRGTTRFGRELAMRTLRLLDTRTLTNGGVALRYAPERG